MPKQKTRKTVAKRFKLTKGGKIMRLHQGGRHLRVKKSKKRCRLYKEPTRLNTQQTRKIKPFI
ncbi:50S ribosomal protein L35 [Candidatus Microgenomates bacterium]|nr:50S ribosomal protein L35 [Candidatus Microgenomates bacterium]